jgi:4-amino-4-deoxy-L-arabinose transferase-like glycosyltransferase
MTSDMAVAAIVPAAALAAVQWAECPDRWRSTLLGVLLGLAGVSKFSALPLLVAGFAAMLLIARRPWPRPGIKPILAVAAVAFLVVWAVYGFTFGRVDPFHLRLPAPRFFSGLHTVWKHNAAGHPSYLLGRRSPTGFWYYFPVVLAIKTPLAILALATGGLLVLWRRKERPAVVFPLVFSLGILAAAMTSRIDIGVRHILPLYGGLAIWCGWVAAQARSRVARIVVAALLGWAVWSGARSHPDYLAYTNEIAGSHPERFVADSDLDWGQDMNRLADLLRAAGADRVTFTPFNRTYAIAGHDMPPMAEADIGHPAPGWNAASVTLWKVFGFPEWVDRVAPQRRVGRGILVWYFPP